MSNGQQFIQWLTDDKFAVVEPAEQMFDGKQDVVIPASGRSIPMHLYGKAFIILNDRNIAMDEVSLRRMYPKEERFPSRTGPAKSLEEHKKQTESASIEVIPEPVKPVEAPVQQQQQKKSKAGSFAANLLAKAKTSSNTLSIEIKVDLPTKQFMQFVSESFDEGVFDEVLDVLLEGVNKEDVSDAIKDAIHRSLIG